MTTTDVYSSTEPGLVEGRHLSNNEIATLVDMHPTAISRIRNGARIPGFDTIDRVRTAYRLPEEWVAQWLLSILDEGAEGSRKFLTAIWG